MAKQSNSFSIKEFKKPWDRDKNPIWLASSLNLIRNIEKYKFPAHTTSLQKKQIVSLIHKEVSNLSQLDHPSLLKADEISPLDKEFLSEHFISLAPFTQAQSGEAFIIDQTGQFLCTINVDDHLHLQFLDTEGKLEESWNKLLRIETELGKSVNYSFSPKFGFLTSDFNLCGTGMLVYIYLQLPALIHTGRIDQLLEDYAEEGIVITGIQGDPREIIGDLLVIRNKFTLGVNEENILSSVETIATKLIVEEKAMRKKLKESGDANLKDMVSRSYGILAHSYQIDAIEALNAISLLKLGADLDWLKGTDPLKMNTLLFNCRRAHLLSQLGEEVDNEKLSHLRAEYIHDNIKKIKLTVE